MIPTLRVPDGTVKVSVSVEPSDPTVSIASTLRGPSMGGGVVVVARAVVVVESSTPVPLAVHAARRASAVKAMGRTV